MFVTFQYRGLHHLDMYFTLITEAWLKSTIHFDCRYLELWNACIINLVFNVLNVREGTESRYPSIVFLSISHSSYRTSAILKYFCPLWSKVIQFSPFITLCLGSIGMDQVISEPYKGTVLQRNYRKMTISFQQWLVVPYINPANQAPGGPNCTWGISCSHRLIMGKTKINLLWNHEANSLYIEYKAMSCSLLYKPCQPFL